MEAFSLRSFGDGLGSRVRSDGTAAKWALCAACAVYVSLFVKVARCSFWGDLATRVIGAEEVEIRTPVYGPG
jgi:hypothetical protein